MTWDYNKEKVDKITHGLMCCSSQFHSEGIGCGEKCPYQAEKGVCLSALAADALAYICDLETERMLLKKKVARLEQESIDLTVELGIEKLAREKEGNQGAESSNK